MLGFVDVHPPNSGGFLWEFTINNCQTNGFKGNLMRLNGEVMVTRN